jgi:ribosomal protein S7
MDTSKKKNLVTVVMTAYVVNKTVEAVMDSSLHTEDEKKQVQQAIVDATLNTISKNIEA